jgi:hypothetical protein
MDYYGIHNHQSGRWLLAIACFLLAVAGYLYVLGWFE